MPVVTPPTITPLPAAPDPNNRATYNTLAYPWSAAQAVLATEVGAVAANVAANATDSAASAGTATTQAGIATAKAVLTAADAVATAADRVQTGQDRAAAEAAAAVAGGAAAFIDSNPVVKGSADATKQVRFEVDGLTTATTRVLTVPDEDLTLAGRGANTFTAAQIYSDQQNSRAMLIDCGYVAIDKGNSGTATQTFDYTAGSVQKVTATGSHAFAFSNWPPAGNEGYLRVDFVNYGAYTITPPTVTWTNPDGTETTSLSTHFTALAAAGGRAGFTAAGLTKAIFWCKDATTVYGRFI